MSLYNLIIDNEHVYKTEPDCKQLKYNILNHPKIKKTNLKDVQIDYMTAENDGDSIFCTNVTMFTLSTDTQDLESSNFYYIPFINKTDNKKYYVLIENNKAFLQTDIKNFALCVKNYEHIFTVVKTTCNHPNIEDIIVKNYIIHREIQYDDGAKIVSNIISNMQMLVWDTVGSENEKFLETKEFERYRHKMNILSKQIIENEKLKYGVDYKLSKYKICTFAPLTGTDTEFSIPEKSKYPVLKYVENKHKNGDEKSAYYFISENSPPPCGLTFSYSLPGKEWEKFYDGIKIYHKKPSYPDLKGKLKQHIDPDFETHKHFDALKKYLDSINEYECTNEENSQEDSQEDSCENLQKDLEKFDIL